MLEPNISYKRPIVGHLYSIYSVNEDQINGDNEQIYRFLEEAGPCQAWSR